MASTTNSMNSSPSTSPEEDQKLTDFETKASHLTCLDCEKKYTWEYVNDDSSNSFIFRDPCRYCREWHRLHPECEMCHVNYNIRKCVECGKCHNPCCKYGCRYFHNSEYNNYTKIYHKSKHGFGWIEKNIPSDW